MELIFQVVVLGVVGIVLFMLLPIYAQYRKHKAPLKVIDPKVNYGFFHHIGLVTIPTVRYRVSAKLKRSKPHAPTPQQ